MRGLARVQFCTRACISNVFQLSRRLRCVRLHKQAVDSGRTFGRFVLVGIHQTVHVPWNDLARLLRDAGKESCRTVAIVALVEQRMQSVFYRLCLVHGISKTQQPNGMS